MKDSIRCCISCILPCGALDVIRIVHVSGRVEEIQHTVCARDVLQAYPKHVLRTPSSFNDNAPPRAIVLPPDAQLHRGKIYFLMPITSSSSSSSSSSNRRSAGNSKNTTDHGKYSSNCPKRRRQKRLDVVDHHDHLNQSRISMLNDEEDRARLLISSDRYLSEILSEKVSTQRERRRGRVGVWRPHLESISESITNEFS